jgi:hypothetical protein
LLGDIAFGKSPENQCTWCMNGAQSWIPAMRDAKGLVASGGDITYIDKRTKELGLSKLWREVQS